MREPCNLDNLMSIWISGLIGGQREWNGDSGSRRVCFVPKCMGNCSEWLRAWDTEAQQPCVFLEQHSEKKKFNFLMTLFFLFVNRTTLTRRKKKLSIFFYFFFIILFSGSIVSAEVKRVQGWWCFQCHKSMQQQKDDRLEEGEQEIAMKLAWSDTLPSDWNSVSVDINSGVVKSQPDTQLVSVHISLWSGTAAETLRRFEMGDACIQSFAFAA